MSDDQEAEVPGDDQGSEDMAINNYPDAHPAEHDGDEPSGGDVDDGQHAPEDGRDNSDLQLEADEQELGEIIAVVDDLVSRVEEEYQQQLDADEKYAAPAGNDGLVAVHDDSPLGAVPHDNDASDNESAMSPRADETEEERQQREEKELEEEVAACVSDLVDAVEEEMAQLELMEQASKRQAAFDVFKQVETAGKKHAKARAHRVQEASSLCRDIVLNCAAAAAAEAEQKKEADGVIRLLLSEMTKQVEREHAEAQEAADRQEVADVLYDLVDRVVDNAEQEERRSRAVRDQVKAEIQDAIALEDSLDDDAIVANVLNDAVEAVELAEEIFDELSEEAAASEVEVAVAISQASNVAQDLLNDVASSMTTQIAKQCIAEELSTGLFSEIVSEVTSELVEDQRIEAIVAQRLREMVNHVAFREEAKAAVSIGSLDKHYQSSLLRSLPFIRPRAARWLAKARASLAKRLNKPVPESKLKPGAKPARTVSRTLRPAEPYTEVAAIERAAAESAAVHQCMEWMLDEVVRMTDKEFRQGKTHGGVRQRWRSRSNLSIDGEGDTQGTTDPFDTFVTFPTPSQEQVQRLQQARWKKVSQVATRGDSSLGDIMVIVGDVEETPDTLYPCEQHHPAIVPYTTEHFDETAPSTTDTLENVMPESTEPVDPRVLKQQTLARNRDCVSKCLIM